MLQRGNVDQCIIDEFLYDLQLIQIEELCFYECPLKSVFILVLAHSHPMQRLSELAVRACANFPLDESLKLLHRKQREQRSGCGIPMEGMSKQGFDLKPMEMK